MSLQFVCCVKCDLGVNPDQCRLISTTFFSPWFVSGKCPFPLFSPHLTMSLKHFLMFYYPLLKKCSLKNNPYFLTKSFFSLFSPCSSPLVYSPCRYSSFSLCFSMLPLLLFALFMFIDSLLCFFCLCLFLFFEKIESILFIFRFVENHWILNWSSLFVKLCWFYLFFCFVPFSVCFSQWCSFEQDQVYHFWEEKTTCLTNPSKNFFSYFLWSDIFSEFYHHVPLQKIWIVWSPFFSFFLKKFWRNMFYHKSCFWNKNIFVQISFCGNLFVFRKIFVSPAFSEKVCLYHIFFVHLQLISATISFEKLFSKKKASFYLLFFFVWRKSFLFFNCLFKFFFALVVFFFSSFFVG